jgi:HTH-type transcriptional regulator / antitoxin HigA
MITVDKDYIKLTKRLPLVIIKNDKHLREANAILVELSGKDMTSGEHDYFLVLCKLTGDYEKDIFPTERMTPIEALEYILEQSQLSRVQLGVIMGCRQSRVTEILNGSRELSKEQIARLSDHFKVSANLFLPVSKKKAA